MRQLLSALLLGVALPLPAHAQVAKASSVDVKPLAFTERTLPNGLRVFALRDTTTSNVSVQVWYNVGSKDDPAGRSGFAHMFEHLMFKASRNLPAESFDRLTEDVGGYNNASTADDYTNYYEVVPANHLQRILFAEADRMASLVVEPASFASERHVVEEELRLRVLAQPYGKLFYLDFPEVSYSTLPYARPGIGSIENLDSSSVEDVRAFHAVYYRPDNAVLVVSGNFDPAQLNRWVDQYFAPIKRPDRAIPRVTATEPPRTAPTRYTVYEPNTPLPAVLISYKLPADRDADTPALTVLNTILAAGQSSRLYQSLVYRQQLAQSAETFLDQKQSAGALAAYAIMAGGKSADAGEAALRAEIARLRNEPVTPAELTQAKNQIVTAAIRSRETPDGKASAIAQAVIIDGDPRAADQQLAAIARVSAADVQRVARKYLLDNASATVRYLPAESAAGAKGDTIAVPATVAAKPLATPADVPVVVAASPAERVQPPAPGNPVTPAIPTPHESRLPNGLRLVVVEKHDLPLVSAVVVTPGGAANDPAGRAGLANLTADLVTKGTRTRSATDIARAVEMLGGSIGSDADRDSAYVSLGVTSNQIEPALAILADSAINPVFAAEEIERSRAQAIDGVNVQLKDPMQLARILAAPVTFGTSPYGHPTNGTPASIKALTRADVTAAYARSWQPDQATLVLSGDITEVQGKALAAKYFGGWRAPAGAPAPLPQAAATYPAPRVIVVDMPDAGQAGVVVARPAITRVDPAYFPAAVANATLGGGYSSRLNEEIRVKRGLSYGATSSLGAGRLPGAVAAATQTKNASAAEVVGLIVGEMRNLGTEPTPAAELDTRKAVLVGNFGRQTETVAGTAGVIASFVTEGVPLEQLKTYIPSVNGVDPAAVQAAARRLLDPAAASIIVVGDAKQFLPALRQAYPQTELIEGSALKLDSPTLR